MMILDSSPWKLSMVATLTASFKLVFRATAFTPAIPQSPGSNTLHLISFDAGCPYAAPVPALQKTG